MVGIVETNAGWPPHELVVTFVAADHVPSGELAVLYGVPVPPQYPQFGSE